MLPLKHSLLCATFMALCMLNAAEGDVIYTLESDIAPAGGSGAYTPVFPSGGPSSTDILNGKQPTASVGNFTQENSTGLTALTNGTVQTFYGNTTAESLHSAYATAGAGGSVTYALGGVYNITSIVVYGGWNDGGRDEQAYNLLTSTNAGQSFTQIATVRENPGIFMTDVTPVSNRIAFTDDSGPNIATGVTNIRLDFLNVENGYTGYTEIDVFGTQQFQTGDANRDGAVNILDFFVISDHFFQVPSAPGLDGDIVVDNLVDVKDFRLWKNVASPAEVALIPANSPVPEPSTVALVGTGLLAFAGLRRRRS